MNEPEEEILLTVVIPVFNEAETIKILLERVLGVKPQDKQIVVVDDCSTDATLEILQGFDAAGAIELLRQSRNCGKGAAIRNGLVRAKGRYTIIQDGDLEYDPNEYTNLLAILQSGEADVAFGSRYLDSNNRPAFRMANPGIWLLNYCVWQWYGLRLTDEATCYKMFATDSLRAMHLECSRFEFCPEVTAKAARMGLRIREIPIRYHARTSAEGKKLRLTDGLAALLELWRWRKWKPPHLSF